MVLLVKRLRLINIIGLCNMESLRWDSVVHGHHVYKDILTPFLGEILHVKQEYHNTEDCFALCIVKGDASALGDIIIGHVLQEFSCLVWYFIEHGGNVMCEITGHRKHGIGLEVPCIYTFSAKKRMIKNCIKS